MQDETALYGAKNDAARHDGGGQRGKTTSARSIWKTISGRKVKQT